VWHEITKEAVARGELVVLGVTQEQHPDRCRLFAQWQGLDFPIMWDPFNLTGTKVVPRATGFDEYGVLVADGLSHDDWEERLLDRPSSPPETPLPMADAESRRTLANVDWLDGACLLPTPTEEGVDALIRFETQKLRAATLSTLLWEAPETWDKEPLILAAAARVVSDVPLARFQAGVAYRMRHDSPAAQPGDFQTAVDHWSAALAADPSQYIWRRRLQQYGPRLDKPYPFYGWVEQARTEILARGETPVPLAVEPGGAERVAPAKGLAPAADETPPDGADGVPRDAGDWLGVESTVVFDTSSGEPVARVHVTLRPVTARKVHWNNEVEPALLWIGDPDLPDGWQADARRLQGELPAEESSTETRRFEFDVRPPAEGGVLRAFVLFYACEDVDGECVYLRRDIELPITPPGDA
jgi:hypothetical protein